MGLYISIYQLLFTLYDNINILNIKYIINIYNSLNIYLFNIHEFKIIHGRVWKEGRREFDAV